MVFGCLMLGFVIICRLECFRVMIVLVCVNFLTGVGLVVVFGGLPFV